MVEQANKQEVKIIQDPDIVDIDGFDARRPYYRIRGPRVTEDQAFEIIRRTDSYFNCCKDSPKYEEAGHIYTQHISNNWFTENNSCSPEGWCHPNGIIGCNSHSGKYPELDEYLWDLTGIAKAFPFLDMIMAVTDWNEIPPYAWDILCGDDEDSTSDAFYMDYPDFIENIQIGFWLHNGQLEILNPTRAQQVYREYEAKYSESNKNIYVSSYYRDNNIFPANYDYLCKIVASYGLDPNEQLKNYPWKDWLNGDPDWRQKLYKNIEKQGGMDAIIST